MESAVEMLTSKLRSAKHPVVIVDCLVHRFGATDAARRLLEHLRAPTVSTPMGKSIVEEGKKYYLGIYNGQVSYPGVIKAVETDSDLVIDLGSLPSDSNTGGHSRKINDDKYILVGTDFVRDATQVFSNVNIVDFLTRLREVMEQSPMQQFEYPSLPAITDPDP
ncbi:hypothetical protein LTR10_019046 [Elasticomyces elasticus]|uniref:Thiamine pyrophosphate enzyme central domain-containing protein n=1 Tax=Exophiala sideris TaxID=1016849 RepID=A0ABR0IYX3_9EURO|nr:hypothetical protein LTR10_019046 [Elasticomyces elasticus]KAK5022932.1 hypothetical protein LTS07_009660 [Exophiala sideris]KAK5026389.1 hypothetical protein LTR13_010003 [Exophiala sideris]KAK5052324.1 hypothetical protein LTR69_009860 [Exophiala sideris]KAK5177351.1 hypothetical protein LTR44_010146 [Eurotiomycetes sp. CCFEE 6388]